MPLELGNIQEDAVLDFHWDTNAKEGGSVGRTGTADTLVVYKGNNTTPTTVGVTDDLEFDGVTGLSHCRIDTSADAFYEVGEDYSVILIGATIDTESVNATIARFSIENRREEEGITRILLALPNAAPDGAGGLPISDAGGLDLDTLLGRLDVAVSTRGTADPGDEMALINDAITAAKYDETTAFPVASVDSGSTQIARTGADGDTLETLSDQLDSSSDVGAVLKSHGLVLHRAAIQTVTDQTNFVIPTTDDATDNDAYNDCLAVFIDQVDPNQIAVRYVTDYVAASRTVTVDIAPNFTIVAGDILAIIPNTIGRLSPQQKLDVNTEADTANSDYGAAQPGDEMDLVNAPNPTAITAIQSGLANPGDEMNLVDGAVTAAKIATNAIDADALAADAVTEIQNGLSTLTAAQVNSEVDTALADIHLDHLVVQSGAIVGSGSSQIALDTNLASAAPNNAYNDMVLVFTTGPNIGQANPISQYLTATGAITFDTADAFTDVPGDGDTFIILAQHVHPFAQIQIAAQNGANAALVANNLDHLVKTATDIPAITEGTYLDQIMDDGTASFDRTTDSLQAIRDRGDSAWITGEGGSGTASIVVSPIRATVSVGEVTSNRLIAYTETKPEFLFAITDDDGEPVDLSGKDLNFIVYTRHPTYSILFSITSGLVASGANNNQVAVELTEDHTAEDNEGSYRYVLRNETDDLVLARGELTIEFEGDVT